MWLGHRYHHHHFGDHDFQHCDKHHHRGLKGERPLGAREVTTQAFCTPELMPEIQGASCAWVRWAAGAASNFSCFGISGPGQRCIAACEDPGVEADACMQDRAGSEACVLATSLPTMRHGLSHPSKTLSYFIILYRYKDAYLGSNSPGVKAFTRMSPSNGEPRSSCAI